MTIKKISFVLMLMTMMCWQAPAWANYSCMGKVTHLGVLDNGVLYVDVGYGTHGVCDIKNDNCKQWSSFATTAKVTERKLEVYYKHATKGGLNKSHCSSIGHWVEPEDPVYYMQLH